MLRTTLFQLLALAFISSVFGRRTDLTTVPNTPTCYQYNASDCEAAKNDPHISKKEKVKRCEIDVKECVGKHAVCIAVWKQNLNETLPEHTDYSFESTEMLSCFPVETQNLFHLEHCGSNCTARKGFHPHPESDTLIVSCCCRGTQCNDPSTRSLNITNYADPTDVVPTLESRGSLQSLYHGLAIAASLGVVGTIVLVIAIVCIRRKHRTVKGGTNSHPLEECDVQEDASLLQAELSIQRPIAQGRYAQVYYGGEINDVPVVIKHFTSAHKKMWQQERDIYRTSGMAGNSNVARFFGATQLGNGNDLTMWIVIQYYPNGSVYDYLKGHTLSWPVMLRLAHSMMKGLAYLHDDMLTVNGQRSALAHRDIKSKNILIKDDMTAAIADFGLAQLFKDGYVNESHAQFQAGTHRYMAPEVLDGAIAFTKNSFLRIDVYASALVLWELLTRCDVAGHVSRQYTAPYEGMDNGRSLLEALQVTVSKEKKRPPFPSCMYRNTDTSTLITTIEESWDADAEARLSAGCVEARLLGLMTAASSGNTELNNMRNLDPPSYDASADTTSPLIPYQNAE